MNAIRVFNTIKHLKPAQILGRPVFWLKRKFFGPAGAGDEARESHELKRLYPLPASSGFSLTFLNRTCEFSADKMFWQSSDWPEEQQPEKLWLYNLNYFDWLFEKKNPVAKELQLFLILDWIENVRSAHSEPWEPFPTSKRILNWIAWLDEFKELATPLRDCIVESLNSQVFRLQHDLEFHNQANHLFANLTALFVGCIFMLESGTKTPVMHSDLAIFSAKELLKQMDEQFFADGGHYERSPMYHLDMLDDVMKVRDCCRQLLKTQPEEFPAELVALAANLHEICQKKLPLMKDWLACLTHPDGLIAQFNDCAIRTGIKSDLPVSEKPSNYLLENSGFFVRRWQSNYFVLSCKEPSPPFQPGHSHCDILSYELSIAGRRCIIDTGCGSYQNAQIREHCRKTASHNTALIELSEQSDIWGAFRIGARAKVISRQFDSEKGILIIELLDQYAQHFRREIVFGPSSIRIRDRMYHRRLTGTFCSLVHLHPDCQIMPASDQGIINLSCHEVEFSIQSGARIRSEMHLCYPEFGREERTVKLILSNHETEAIDYVISWNT